MKKLLLFFILIGINPVYSQKVTDTIFSKKLNEDREITISLPPSYHKNKAQKYPVLILLDSDFLLDPLQGSLLYGYYWDDLPEIIIVGINQNKNNEREMDCTVDEETGLPMEKGEKFFEFIGLELLPYIQTNYRIAPFKMIAGLDTTAGFLNFYLYKENPLFDAYISMSPELPTGMEERIPERLAAIQKPIFYYHSAAEGDNKKMRSRIQKMDDLIRKINNPNLNYKFDDFKGASHYSLVLHSLPSAFYQIFSIYQPITPMEFQEKIATLPEGYVDYLIKKYDILEKSLGLKTQIRLNDFKAIEAAILKNKAYNEFDQLAQLAQRDYPKTMLADYHMAQMYEKKGDLKHALRYYQNGYQMQEIGDLTKDMMLDKADELTRAVKNEKNKPVEVIEETPTETPAEAPTETPTEEKKSE